MREVCSWGEAVNSPLTVAGAAAASERQSSVPRSLFILIWNHQALTLMPLHFRSQSWLRTMSLIASDRFRYPFSRIIRSSALSSDLLKETPKRASLSLAMVRALLGMLHHCQLSSKNQRVPLPCQITIPDHLLSQTFRVYENAIVRLKLRTPPQTEIIQMVSDGKKDCC
jgi:hypothetical protein